MRLKAIVFLLIIIAFSTVNLPACLHKYLLFERNLYASDNLLSGESPNYQYKDQSDIIKSILDNENNTDDLKKIIKLLNHIDDVYGNLYNKIKSGEKIIIFFDPAHGKLKNGKWEGEVTGRISSRGLPEEYYSVQFSRKLYRLLKRNKYIDVKSTDDYMRVIRNESNEYNNIPFSETIKYASEEKAFIIISEHLNNISTLKKADGIINLSGIHITRDDFGNRYLKYVNGVHKGFLTLYNKYDATGFSRKIANRTKKLLSAKGVKMNSWEYGAVADDRFSYFVDFPISVIYEIGFISNPDEEKLVRDPDYQDLIVQSQYTALLDCFEEIFGIDISGFWVKETKDNTDNTDLIKLSRIVIYYLQNNDPDKAVSTISRIENKYKKSRPELISHFSEIKRTVIRAENKYNTAFKNIKRKRYKTAEKYIRSAIRYVNDEPVYAALKEKYTDIAYRYFKIKEIDNSEDENIRISIINTPQRSPVTKPVILAISDDQSLEQAVNDALQPCSRTLDKLMRSVKNAHVWKRVLAKKYSKKRKRTIRYWKWKRINIDFREGLYLIRLNKKLQVTSVKRTSQILLDPDKYQNQQYLKNSYFAVRSREKIL